MIDHHVALRVDPAAGTLAGHGTIVVRAVEETRSVAIEADGLVVDEAIFGAERRSFEQAGGRLCVALDRPLRAGSSAALQLSWHRPASARPTEGPVRFYDGSQAWAGYGTSAWMPTVLAAAQRATLDLTIDAPPGLDVVASGRRVEGERPRFVVDVPSPTFLFAFAVGRFAKAELKVGDALLVAHGPSDADLADVLARTGAMLRFFETRLRARLPGDRYDQAFVKGDAAQEAVGLALIGEDYVRDLKEHPQEDWVFSHELAHQWFARALPCADFGDFWLNEGFATFLVAAFKEEAWGKPAYEREIELFRARSKKVTEQGKDAPVAPRPDAPREADPKPGPRGITYSRGALVLHRLRAELGDPLFWSGLSRYVTDQAGKSPRTGDFQRAMQTATGKDLGPFFDRWVYRPAPDL